MRFLFHFTRIENEVVSWINQGKSVTEELLHGWETQLRVWLQEFSCQHDRPHSILVDFANIRFGWQVNRTQSGVERSPSRLCILLRYPFLDHAVLGLASLSTIARSVSRILQSYHTITSDERFVPKWAELRRITTCAHLLVLCYWEKEFAREEAETLAADVGSLLKWMEPRCPQIAEVLPSVETLFNAASRFPFPRLVHDTP